MERSKANRVNICCTTLTKGAKMRTRRYHSQCQRLKPTFPTNEYRIDYGLLCTHLVTGKITICAHFENGLFATKQYKSKSHEKLYCDALVNNPRLIFER